MSTNHSTVLTKLLPIFFICILTIIFFHPVIFQGKTFYAFDILHKYLPWSSIMPNIRPHNPLINDPVNAFYPYKHSFKHSISTGSFPLWNNNNFCGVPFVATAISPATNPLICLLTIILPLTWSHDLILWIHLFGSGLFMFLYLRTMGLARLPGLLGSVAWMFNGYVMVWFEFEHIPILACSLPAALYFIERWLNTRAKLHCLGFFLTIGIAINTGYAHGVIYQLIFIGTYLPYRILQSRKENGHFLVISRKHWLFIALSTLLAIYMSANVLVSHLTLLGETQREGFSFSQLYQQTGQLPGKYLVTLLFPDFFRSPTADLACIPRPAPPQPYNNSAELCIYPGVLSLFLALCCLPFFFKRKHTAFYTITSLTTLLMAMGSIIYYPLATFLPGLNLSTPTRVLYIFGFSISVMAAIGGDIIITLENNKNKMIVFIQWVLLVSAAMTIYFWLQTQAGIHWAVKTSKCAGWNHLPMVLKQHFSLSSTVMLKPLVLVMASFLLLSLTLFIKGIRVKSFFLFIGIIILSYDLISYGSSYNTVCSRHLAYIETGAIRFLKKAPPMLRVAAFGNFLHNTFSPFNIHDIGGYASFYPKRYGEFLHLSQHGLHTQLPDRFKRATELNKFGSPLLDLINLKYIIVPPAILLKLPMLDLVYDKEVKIYKNNSAFPRFFCVPEFQFCESREKAYQALSAYTHPDFRKKVILEDLPQKEYIEDHDSNQMKIDAAIRVISYAPNRIELSVNSNRKGFLVIGDNYHPDWQATIEGKRVPVFRANYIMRTIPIKAGYSKVVLTFRPYGLITSMVLTAVGWLIMFTLICIYSFRYKQTGRVE